MGTHPRVGSESPVLKISCLTPVICKIKEYLVPDTRVDTSEVVMRFKLFMAVWEGEEAYRSFWHPNQFLII